MWQWSVIQHGAMAAEGPGHTNYTEHLPGCCWLLQLATATHQPPGFPITGLEDTVCPQQWAQLSLLEVPLPMVAPSPQSWAADFKGSCALDTHPGKRSLGMNPASDGSERKLVCTDSSMNWDWQQHCRTIQCCGLNSIQPTTCRVKSQPRCISVTLEIKPWRI